MRHTKYFNQFLENEVNLNKNRIETLDKKVKTISDYLNDKLDNYQKRENQGSYGMKTIIKPPKDKDFDADIIIYIKYKDDFKPKDYIDEIYNLFKDDRNYKAIVSRRSRCIEIDYSGDFHLDIVPCIEANNQKFICNKNTNKFEKTDGTEYKKWLTEKNNDSHGYLKKVTKLFKYMRDIKTNFSCKSILLTTLLGNQIRKIENFSDLPIALKEIFNRLNDFLQTHSAMPTIKNPVLDNEDFNRHWDQDKYSNFRDKIKLYTDKINKAFNNTDHNESVRKWREVFGDEFGKLKENSAFTTRPNKPYCDRWH